MAPRLYTPEDDATLVAMNGTHSRRAIAAHLGRSMRSIVNRMEVLGIRRPVTNTPYSETEDALIRELVILQPVTLIADQLGRITNSVHARIQKLGLGPGTPHGERQHKAKLTALQAGMLQTLHAAGYTVAEMNTALNLPVERTALYDAATGRNWKQAEVRA